MSHQPQRYVFSKTGSIEFVLAKDYDELLGEWAEAATVQDIARDLLDGIENGYPLSDGSWEGDVVARLTARLRSPETELEEPS